ncbi:hypothetical protein [Xylocopilactobacillus apis]|uniref:Uncharacterized protein n=1 Tax=Xylocopilactobacillus apis TaxID=2932183 RepID=A0AAU9DJ76_9LACO|nr:hypothetical protein [Xylocopilactobacillus apis]BDR56862.1 hypothetical protein KIMC2_14240 [Xylocopilactobacillus apis]
MVVPESQIKASKAWKGKNRGRNAYINNRSATKYFLSSQATKEDLDELKKIIEDREGFWEAYDDTKVNYKDLIDEGVEDKMIPQGVKPKAVDAKSVLCKDPEYQHLWETFKQIQGDPFLLILSNDAVLNLITGSRYNWVDK